jgi:hypothetical protein
MAFKAEANCVTAHSGMYDNSDLESTRRSLTGFISISADGRDLFVAHNWGE